MQFSIPIQITHGVNTYCGLDAFLKKTIIVFLRSAFDKNLNLFFTVFPNHVYSFEYRLNGGNHFTWFVFFTDFIKVFNQRQCLLNFLDLRIRISAYFFKPCLFLLLLRDLICHIIYI